VLVAVVDVAARLGATPLPTRVDDVLVLCRSKDRRLALCLTELPSLHRVETQALVPLPLDQYKAPFVAGCVTVGHGSVPLISVWSLSLASGLLAEAM
jgi:chemotaxis signal transduction protein